MWSTFLSTVSQIFAIKFSWPNALAAIPWKQIIPDGLKVGLNMQIFLIHFPGSGTCSVNYHFFLVLLDGTDINGRALSQHHPSNWVDADEDDDEGDETELCVQSTPPYSWRLRPIQNLSFDRSNGWHSSCFCRKSNLYLPSLKSVPFPILTYCMDLKSGKTHLQGWIKVNICCSFQLIN